MLLLQIMLYYPAKTVIYDRGGGLGWGGKDKRGRKIRKIRKLISPILTAGGDLILRAKVKKG